MRTRTLRAEREQGLPGFRQNLPDFRLRLFEVPGGFAHCLEFDQNILAGEFTMRIAAGRNIAARLNAVVEVENFRGRSKRGVDLFLAPDVERALFFVAVAGIDDPGSNDTVGILRGEKASFIRRHIATDVIERIARDFFEERLARDLERFEIRHRQLRLVVEHFFEMRNVPVTVDRIAVEPAAKMIMHAARRHFAESE